MSIVNILEGLSRKLDETSPPLRDLDAYYSGSQPLAFLSAEAKEALGDRLRVLQTNYPRLVVDSIAERLRVKGFTVNGTPALDIYAAWEAAGMEDSHGVAHTEALTLGRSFVTVWADSTGAPVITVESPHEVAVVRDPLSREVTAAAKRWREDGRARATLLLPDRIYHYVSSARVPEGGVIPPEGWQHMANRRNPLGEVPVVPFVNRGRLLDVDGVSEMRDVTDLSDAIAKLLADLMVSSEFGSRPRRWATGMEVKEEQATDADGTPLTDEVGDPVMVAVNPFGNGPSRVWQAEEPDASFGQFPTADLTGYGSAVELMLQSISAVSGLPAHYLGIHGDQPASADAIRSAEASLVARCHARMRSFGPSWAKVASLTAAVQNGSRPQRVEVVWDSPETRTVAQEADAVTKLVQANIMPTEEALARLGYDPQQIHLMRQMRQREALDKQITAPPTALPEAEQ
ncbi:hypothetical protein ASG90_20545 [Nocardioides sp. Soil797]|nr:hypothetical protein ASG90_20545 [Nocardioides sp. Soil797]